MGASSSGSGHPASGAALLARGFERAPIALALVDREGYVLEVNERFRALTGYAPEALRHMRLADLVAPREPGADAALRALSTAATPCASAWCQRADGQIRRFLFRASPLGGGTDCEALGTVAVEDVTDRLEAAEEQARTLRTLSASLERSTDGFIALDRDWRYVYANTEGARLLGRTPEQLIGKHIWTEFPDGVGQPFHRAYEKAMNEQVFVSLESYYPPFGRWFENRIYPSADGICIYFHDITDRVMARERAEQLTHSLGAERRWLEAVLEHMPTPMVLVQPGTGRVTFANEAAIQIAGALLLKDDGSGGDAGGWCDESEQALGEAELPQLRAARGETLVDLQVCWRSPSGQRWLLCNSTNVPGLDGHPATCVLAFQDITPLKRFESQLARAVAERDEFLSIASHELRTPLAGLSLQVHALIRHVRSGVERGLPPDEIAAKAGPLLRSLARLTKLVQNLLDVSALRGGQLVLDRERVDASALVRDAIGHLRDELDEARCQVSLHVQSGVIGQWDRARLEQVLTQLVMNAAKYGRGNAIEVSLEAWGGRAWLTVRDHGIGIAPEDQARIFEPFERAVSTRHYGGFGLGLWIVRRIVEAMGGSIRVESHPGEGSAFVVELACEQPQGPWVEPQSASAHPHH